MARRTAMSKEPKTESSREGERRLPGKPGNFDDKGNRKPSENLTRLSPGVYRNSQGKLVGSRGQSLGNRDGRPGDAIRNALGDMTNPGALTPAARPGQQTPPAGIPQDWFQQWQQMQQNPGSFPQQKPAPLTPEMNDQLQGVMRDMRNQRQPNTQFDPRMMQPYLPFQPNQQPPMNWGNMRYDFPQGQALTQEQMKAALQPFQPQGQQQPNSMSGMLKRYS